MQTSGGDMRVDQVDGQTRVSTSGGDIDIARLNGDLDAKTSGGYIHLDDVVGKVVARTSGGDVTAELVGENRGISVSSSGGDLTVRVPKGTTGELDAATSGGSVRTEI